MEVSDHFHAPAAVTSVLESLGVSQNWSRCFGEQKSFTLTGIRTIGRTAQARRDYNSQKRVTFIL